MKQKYPEIDAYQSAYLETSDGHQVYYEQSGNPEGHPIVFVHGGPGQGTDPGHRQYFNPEKYRIILIDQRGCGKSKPFGELANNNTWKLIEDFETIRKFLNIEKWSLYGVSWGSTLSLIYAITYPHVVQSLVLRGIFLARPEDIHWYFGGGAEKHFPDQWKNFIERLSLDNNSKDSLFKQLLQKLQSTNSEEKLEAARAWGQWTGVGYSTQEMDFSDESYFESPEFTNSAILECLYHENSCYLDHPNWILEKIDKIQSIPTHLIHGDIDFICPLAGAELLAKHLPSAKLIVAKNAAHASSDPANLEATLTVLDKI